MELVEDFKEMVTRDSDGRWELNLSKRGLTSVPEALGLVQYLDG